MSTLSIHQFAEKVALISDAASPVGRAVCLQLALQGAFVIAVYPERTVENERAVNELTELGTLAKAVFADVSTPEGAKIAADAVADAFGRLDLLVNCLKYRPQSSFEDMTGMEFRTAVDRNFGSVFFMTRAVLGLMKERPKPKIVNLVSASTGIDTIFDPLQAAAAALTQPLVSTLPKNFRVNCVEVNENPTFSGNGSDAVLPVAADDAARTVMFLLSSESVGMNGQTLRVG